ncbi:MAG: sulfurtransferase [Alphaproteobacteria bacterium PA2]|nr:MAG: sulfurtransferase [Alphaproteobacteria bacterium PA2]
MTLDRAVFAFLGCVILLGVALAHYVHPWWIGLTIFAGLNALQTSVTGFCPAAIVFKKLGIAPGVAFK